MTVKFKRTKITNCSVYDNVAFYQINLKFCFYVQKIQALQIVLFCNNAFLILKSAKLSNQLCCKFEDSELIISRRKCDFFGNSKKISSNHSSESNNHQFCLTHHPVCKQTNLQASRIAKSESVLQFYR